MAVEVTTNFTVKLRSVKVLGFEITEAGKVLDHPIVEDGYEYRWNLRVDAIKAERSLDAVLTTHLAEKAAPKVDLATLKIQLIIEVKNFEAFQIDDKTQQVIIPAPLMPVIGGIAVATARGIFLLCVLPTKFSNALIPLINPNLFKVSGQTPVEEVSKK